MLKLSNINIVKINIILRKLSKNKRFGMHIEFH